LVFGGFEPDHRFDRDRFRCLHVGARYPCQTPRARRLKVRSPSAFTQ
jgi:hypothetical protein